MPNYAPCIHMRSIADVYSAKNDESCPLQISYGGFWDAFYQPPVENSLRCLFRALFSGMGITRPIVIVSVFQGTPSLANIQKTEGTIYVSFSGEPHHLNPDWFDVNLIMKPTDINNRIVSLPNFVCNSHEMGLWPYLSIPRPLFPVEKKKFCAFIVRNGAAHVRKTFMERLSAYKKVDCAGSFKNNIGYTAPEDELVYGDRYFPFLQQYKFIICFENTKSPTYVTEKLLNAYVGGTIPIYWGTHDVKKWFNTKSFLFLEDESDESMDILIDKIKKLDQNDRLYEEMYAQPLLRPSHMPKEWTIPCIRENIQSILRAQGLCA